MYRQFDKFLTFITKIVLTIPNIFNKGETMKKSLALAALVLCSNAWADWEIAGQITAVDSINHTITLNGNTNVHILPYTKLVGDDCGFFYNDTYGNFSDLEVGKLVEADVYKMQTPTQQEQFVAQKVEWKCVGWMDSKKAY